MNAELAKWIERCKSAGACSQQLNPLIAAAERGDDESAWATFRGNRDWVLIKLPDFPHEILDNGLTVYWHANAQIWERFTRKDGNIDGLCEYRKANGRVYIRKTYKDGITISMESL